MDDGSVVREKVTGEEHIEDGGDED